MLVAKRPVAIREMPQRRGQPTSELDGRARMTRAHTGDRCAMTTTTTSQAAITKSFSELSKEDVAYAGGKGANLGELSRAGLPVPPGFVVGAPSYALYCAESGVRSRLDEILADVDVEDGGALEAASSAARQAVLDAPMPPALESAIVAAYRELVAGDDAVAVAVRASATAEDTASASFAGMNETFLTSAARPPGRRGERVLGLAVRRAHDLLPRPARLQPGRHGHRCRRADADPLDPRRRDVHGGPLDGRTRPPRDRGVVRARRGGGLGQRLARPLRRAQERPGDHHALGSPEGAADSCGRAAGAAGVRAPRRAAP
jgi:hypothetical protein